MSFDAAVRRAFSRFVREYPRGKWLALVGGLLAISFWFWGGALGGMAIKSQLESRLGVPVRMESCRAGLIDLHVYGLVIGGADGRPPLAVIDRLDVPFAGVWGGGTVVVRRPHVEAHRGGPKDNVTAILERVRGKRGERTEPGSGGGSGRSLPEVKIEDGAVVVVDAGKGGSLSIGVFNAKIAPGKTLFIDARDITGRLRLRGGENDPTFGAASIQIEGEMTGLRPVPYPRVRITDGFVQPLATLPLTGITGTCRPGSALSSGETPLEIELSGSYGGAKRSLWTARGSAVLSEAGAKGKLSLRAERFSLDKIADILPASVLKPQDTRVDAAMELTFSHDRVGFEGGLEVTGLNLRHEKLASEPMFGLGFSLRFDGAIVPDRRRLEITRFEGRIGDLVGRIMGAVELAPGRFQYADGSEMPALPKIDLQIQVPRMSCGKLLTSVPPQIVPRLQGFVLQGTFDADLRVKIDYANLDALELGGKVGIDGCKVLKASDEVAKLAGPDSIIQVVDVPPKLDDPGTIETYMFPIGPDNPDFTPYDKISPAIINSIMTTEDNGFFKHHGWVTPEFKTALRRNLMAGRFRFGASSISMQMVKNVLLAHEKTLSRKLQELFLTWYIEHLLPKERILELYFNAIEFGPRIYGIGAATRHYFGKKPADITPLEAAFFSSILPSPKRRYVQYCAGALNAKWDKYVRRIMAKAHERGRMTDEEYEAYSVTPFTFDVSERKMTEKQCMEWVKRITRPEPEPEAVDPEAP